MTSHDDADRPEGPDTPPAEHAAAPPAPTVPPRRRRRLLRWVVGLTLTLILLVALLAGLAWYAVSSERGTGFVLDRVAGVLPGQLTIGSRKGALLGPLELRDVHYSDPAGLDVRIGRLDLAWDPSRLRHKQLDVRRLHAEKIRVTLPPPGPEDATADGKLIDIHLPVNVIVRDALIRDLEIARPEQPGLAPEPPFRLDRIALDARSVPGGDAIEIRTVQVDGPTFDLRAAGRVTPVGDYPVDLRLTASYRDPQYPPFALAGALSGSLEKLGVDARLSGPFAARVQGNVTAPMRELGLDLAAQVRDFAAQSIDPTWPAARVARADVTIRGALDDFASAGTIAGTIASSHEDFGSAEATYRLTRKGEGFQIESLQVKTPNGSDLRARGTIDAGGETLALNLDAAWNRLAWPLQGQPTVVSRNGEASVQGTLADYEVTLAAGVSGEGLPPGRWSFTGRGDQEKMTIRGLRGDVLGGRLAATGAVSWQPKVTWKARLTGQNLNPAAQWPEWPGKLTFAAVTEGRLEEAGPFGSVDLTDLDGNVRGNPVAGRIHLELLGDRYRLPRLDLRSGTARLTAAGAFSTTAGTLDFQLAAPNLGEALPDAGGSLLAKGNVSGPWSAPRVRAEATGDSLVFQTNTVASLKLNADVDLSPAGTILLDLDAAGVGLGERRFETVTVDGNGTRGDHRIALAVRAPEGNLNVGLAGAFQQATTSWTGSLTALTLANEQTGTWQLQRPAGLTAGPQQAALRDFCWVSVDRAPISDQSASLCAEGSWAQAGPWSASGTVGDLPFSLFKPFLPADLEITGGVRGSFAGQGSPAGVVTAHVDLRPGPGEVRYPTPDGDTAVIRFDQGAVLLDAGANGLAGSADLTFVDTGTLKAELRLPQYNAIGAPLQEQTLAGRIVADFSNLGLAEAFVADLENVRGTFKADLGLGGTVAAPQVTGSANLAGAQLDVPSFGLKLREVQLAAEGQGTGPLALRGSLRSGPGTLNLTGEIVRDGGTSRLRVQGRNLLASDTEEARVVVSPNLEITLDGPTLKRVNVTGDVQVPEALIVQGKRKGTVGISSDVVILPASEETVVAAGEELELRAKVRLLLGDEVEIRASGFTGEVTGSLLVTEQPGKATTGVGELRVTRGVYKSYGQDLTLERGRIVFAGGPIDNPGLDLRAYRRADDGTIAGVIVRGTLESPQATLYSDPPMGQSEALAYLLLGHPLGQASPQEGDLVANAANSLGLKGGNMIAKRIAARFGLEEARIESSGGLDEARLVVGRYLSPRLYVTYGLGLFEPVSTFRLRYILGRSYTLQAEQGDETRADILYRKEQGKGGETPVPSRQDPAEPVPVPAGSGVTGGGDGR